MALRAMLHEAATRCNCCLQCCWIRIRFSCSIACNIARNIQWTHGAMDMLREILCAMLYAPYYDSSDLGGTGTLIPVYNHNDVLIGHPPSRTATTTLSCSLVRMKTIPKLTGTMYQTSKITYRRKSPLWAKAFVLLKFSFSVSFLSGSSKCFQISKYAGFVSFWLAAYGLSWNVVRTDVRTWIDCLLHFFWTKSPNHPGLSVFGPVMASWYLEHLPVTLPRLGSYSAWAPPCHFDSFRIVLGLVSDRTRLEHLPVILPALVAPCLPPTGLIFYRNNKERVELQKVAAKDSGWIVFQPESFAGSTPLAIVRLGARASNMSQHHNVTTGGRVGVKGKQYESTS